MKIAETSSERGGGRLRPTWYEHHDCKGSHRTSSRHADVDKDAGGWQTLFVDKLIPPQNSKSMAISIIHTIEGPGEHVMLLDDIYFRAY
ncbi:MAG: hypothetical protein ACI9J2_002122 [Saprospiraceae bacterium]